MGVYLHLVSPPKDDLGPKILEPAVAIRLPWVPEAQCIYKHTNVSDLGLPLFGPEAFGRP